MNRPSETNQSGNSCPVVECQFLSFEMTRPYSKDDSKYCDESEDYAKDDNLHTKLDVWAIWIEHDKCWVVAEQRHDWSSSIFYSCLLSLHVDLSKYNMRLLLLFTVLGNLSFILSVSILPRQDCERDSAICVRWETKVPSLIVNVEVTYRESGGADI